MIIISQDPYNQSIQESISLPLAYISILVYAHEIHRQKACIRIHYTFLSCIIGLPDTMILKICCTLYRQYHNQLSHKKLHHAATWKAEWVHPLWLLLVFCKGIILLVYIFELFIEWAIVYTSINTSFWPWQGEKPIPPERQARIEEIIEPWFIFTVVWTIGATCDNDSRKKFSQWMRETCKKANVSVYKELNEIPGKGILNASCTSL